MKRSLTLLAALCALPGLAMAAFAMFAAWDHNPQGEFHTRAADGSLVIHWGGWIAIGLSWFLLVFAPLFLFSASIAALARARRKRKEKQ